MSVHDGHRERLKARYIEHGLASFNDLNALELLLFYAIPRKDTNVLAHSLLDKFGSLAGVFDASVYELMEVPGIGESAAVLISVIPHIMRKSLISQKDKNPVIKSAKAAGEFLMPRFAFEREEIIIMLCLDAQKKLISSVEVARGVVNSVETNVRRIAELALKNRASSVILSHNHPDGVLYPSREDDYVTKQTSAALEAICIHLDDHIIVAGDRYVSYAESGLFELYRR